jgi:hypothetical protein
MTALSRRKRYLALGAAVLTSAVLATPTLSASAYESTQETTAEARMTFTPWTVENLADHGFELRYNELGEPYGVPTGTPQGSTTNATAPIRDADQGGSLGEVRGDCGTSFVSFSAPKIVRTGYYILPNKGAPISHSWSVTLHSSIDIELKDFSGAAPWGYQSWQSSRNYDLQYLRGSTVSALASGSVLTTAGICASGNPTEVTRP